jgi:hypothetical protein
MVFSFSVEDRAHRGLTARIRKPDSPERSARSKRKAEGFCALRGKRLWQLARTGDGFSVPVR